MSEIDIVVSDMDGGGAPVFQDAEHQVTAHVNKGRVIQENYVLNDAAALKKKMMNEMDRKEPFDTGAQTWNSVKFFREPKSTICGFCKILGIVSLFIATLDNTKASNQGKWALLVLICGNNPTYKKK